MERRSLSSYQVLGLSIFTSVPYTMHDNCLYLAWNGIHALIVRGRGVHAMMELREQYHTLIGYSNNHGEKSQVTFRKSVSHYFKLVSKGKG